MTRGVVAVTGATGFLGRHLVRALAADGWTVRVLARRDIVDSGLGGARAPGRDRRPGGSQCAESPVRRRDRGHPRRRPDQGQGSAAFDRVNVEGARDVALAAKAAGRG
jgi:nucleoside-diphosphate-sugar epimerase